MFEWFKFIKLFLREGQRWAQTPSKKNIAGKNMKNASILCSSYCVIKLSSCGSVSNLSDFIFISCVLTIKIQNQSFASLSWWMIEMSIDMWANVIWNHRIKAEGSHFHLAHVSVYVKQCTLEASQGSHVDKPDFWPRTDECKWVQSSDICWYRLDRGLCKVCLESNAELILLINAQNVFK